MKSLLAAMLGSTALLMMPEAEGAGGGPDADGALARDGKLRAAVSRLDDAVDSHWNADGTANMLAVEGFFGDSTPTRAEVDAIGRVREAGMQASALKDPNPEPPDASLQAERDAQKAGMEDKLKSMVASGAGGASSSAEPQPPQPISKGRFVTLTLSKPFDGETEVVGLVVKVAEDGTANVRAFAPNGGADAMFTGVHHVDDVAAMPEGADKNAARSATWAWPKRD